MTMFAEAMKGSRLSIHSSGNTIIRSMFSQYDGGEFLDVQESPWADVICGVLTSLIHLFELRHLQGRNGYHTWTSSDGLTALKLMRQSRISGV